MRTRATVNLLKAEVKTLHVLTQTTRWVMDRTKHETIKSNLDTKIAFFLQRKDFHFLLPIFQF